MSAPPGEPGGQAERAGRPVPLFPGSACLPPSRLWHAALTSAPDPLTPAEQDHCRVCPRCRGRLEDVLRAARSPAPEPTDADLFGVEEEVGLPAEVVLPFRPAPAPATAVPPLPDNLAGATAESEAPADPGHPWGRVALGTVEAGLLRGLISLGRLLHRAVHSKLAPRSQPLRLDYLEGRDSPSTLGSLVVDAPPPPVAAAVVSAIRTPAVVSTQVPGSAEFEPPPAQQDLIAALASSWSQVEGELLGT
jgi:hypothetical protein